MSTQMLGNLSDAERDAMQALWRVSRVYEDWARETCEGVTQDRIDADIGRLTQAGFALGKVAKIIAAATRESNCGSYRPDAKRLAQEMCEAYSVSAIEGWKIIREAAELEAVR